MFSSKDILFSSIIFSFPATDRRVGSKLVEINIMERVERGGKDGGETGGGKGGKVRQREGERHEGGRERGRDRNKLLCLVTVL